MCRITFLVAACAEEDADVGTPDHNTIPSSYVTVSWRLSTLAGQPQPCPTNDSVVSITTNVSQGAYPCSDGQGGLQAQLAYLAPPLRELDVRTADGTLYAAASSSAGSLSGSPVTIWTDAGYMLPRWGRDADHVAGFVCAPPGNLSVTAIPVGGGAVGGASYECDATFAPPYRTAVRPIVLKAGEYDVTADGVDAMGTFSAPSQRVTIMAPNIVTSVRLVLTRP